MSPSEKRPVFGYEGAYEISSDGEITSLPKINRAYPIRLKSFAQKSGHLVVNLSVGGVVIKQYVHRLVALTFLGTPPEGYEVRHLDGNPANNHLSNLVWGSPAENQRDRLIHGTDNRGEKHGRAKLTAGSVTAIRRALSAGESKASLSRKFSVSESAIRAIANRSNWKHA